ncbi:MAG: hypothetical protein KC657_18290 [Myxococcales bacterium]|nr:hypothetical protein [Myxococcales bacterium]
MEPAVDLTTLPVPAQKIVDPAGPAPLRQMAAKGLAPGLRPGDALTVLVLLAEGADAAIASTAQATLESIPAPLLNGALGGPLPAGVLDVIAPRYGKDTAIAERILQHASIAAHTVAAMAKVASEAVCELIATNEERLLKHPEIIENLYLNKRTRMSTADRVLELAVRHGLELKIPAYEQAAAAIRGELIAEPSEEPTFDDTQFDDAKEIAKEVSLAEGADTHQVNEETGIEEVVADMRPLHAIWAELRAPAKIRLLQIAAMEDEEGERLRFDAKALRLLGVRDANPLVAVTAIKSPGTSESEVARITTLRNIHEDVLRAIALNRDWTRHYQVKLNLVANPRTPFAFASQWIPHLRENDLKSIARSKDVSGAVANIAKQRLNRKNK